MATTSNRMPPRGADPLAATYDCARRTMRRCLAAETASSAVPARSDLRVLTSTNTSSSSSRATMSSSPAAERQLRTSICIPTRSRNAAAASSPLRAVSERSMTASPPLHMVGRGAYCFPTVDRRMPDHRYAVR